MCSSYHGNFIGPCDRKTTGAGNIIFGQIPSAEQSPNSQSPIPKLTLNSATQSHTIYVLLVSQSNKFHRLSLYGKPFFFFFFVTGHFETSASNDPKMTLDTEVKGTPYACYNHPNAPNFTTIKYLVLFKFNEFVLFENNSSIFFILHVL